MNYGIIETFRAAAKTVAPGTGLPALRAHLGQGIGLGHGHEKGH